LARLTDSEQDNLIPVDDILMSQNTFLRHTLATINYRANASICDAPDSLAEARASAEHWSGLQILRHMNDVLNWAYSIAKGKQEWEPTEPQSWQHEVANFHAVLAAFDGLIAGREVAEDESLKLFQGPLADVLTHIGQLASLRRSCGANVPPQNYHTASIQLGEFGPIKNG
jgi:hypothetical protein